eukprot:gene16526-19622_t
MKGMAKLTKVDVVIKQKVVFAKGKKVVHDLNIPALLAVVEIMRDHPQIKLGIQGRGDVVDPSGNMDFQVRLAHDRAESVCNWLVSQ